ncbi:MAG TPA: hypothetical protein VK962_07290 [Actinomycetota bacterium]|jgi:hypothetical protein|nr:hypothetical protein [Actinomycetota bacterium]
MKRPLVVLLGLAALVLAALVLTACGENEFRYVRNSDTRTAFKVPNDWTLFDKQTFLRLPPGPNASTPDPIEWLVAVDGDPSPDVQHILNAEDLATEHPQGIALVFTLSPENRDQASFEYVRNFLIPVDDLTQLGSDNVMILGYNDTLTGEEGLRGSHIVFQFRTSALGELQAGQGGVEGGGGSSAFSPEFVVVNQIAYLDGNADKVYLMALMCSNECYSDYQQDIDDTIDSWTVRP